MANWPSRRLEISAPPDGCSAALRSQGNGLFERRNGGRQPGDFGDGACSTAAARKHVVTTAIEHPAVLNPCRQLEREGVDVTYVRVGSDGVVDPEDIRRALRPETILISVMHANNELGTVQPIAEIAAIAREAGVLLHSDGVQAAGKIPVDVQALGVDLYSISGHKFYAPKGIGALYVKNGTKLRPDSVWRQA